MTSNNPIGSLGEYLREQRQSARLSLRQLSELAGVSNPYLSQIERGLKKPSAEILHELAKGLQISAESLYVKAGFLDERTVSEHRPWDVETAIAADHVLTDRQKETLIDVYRSFVGDKPTEGAAEARTSASAVTTPATKRAPARKAAKKQATAKKAATASSSARKSSTSPKSDS